MRDGPGHRSFAPAHVFAPPTVDDHTRLLALLHGPLRLALCLVMVLMSLEGYPASTIAGLSDRPLSGRPRLGGPRLQARIRRRLAIPGPGRGPHRNPSRWGALSAGPSSAPSSRPAGAGHRPGHQRRLPPAPRAGAGRLSLPAIAVLPDHVAIHRSRVVTRWLEEHPQVRLILGPRSCPPPPGGADLGARRTALATTPVETMAGRDVRSRPSWGARPGAAVAMRLAVPLALVA